MTFSFSLFVSHALAMEVQRCLDIVTGFVFPNLGSLVVTLDFASDRFPF